MFTEDLDELEVAILLKRLEILKAQGITGRRVFSLGDDFFALMKDKWIFDGVLSTIQSLAPPGSGDPLFCVDTTKFARHLNMNARPHSF